MSKRGRVGAAGVHQANTLQRRSDLGHTRGDVKRAGASLKRGECRRGSASEGSLLDDADGASIIIERERTDRRSHIDGWMWRHDPDAHWIIV